MVSFTHAPCLLKLCIPPSNGIVWWWFFPEFGAELPLDNCYWLTFMKCKHTKRLLTAVRRHLSELRSKRRNAQLPHTAHHKRKLTISWSIGATTYFYPKCIVHGKLSKPRQSFRLTLYSTKQKNNWMYFSMSPCTLLACSESISDCNYTVVFS